MLLPAENGATEAAIESLYSWLTVIVLLPEIQMLLDGWLMLVAYRMTNRHLCGDSPTKRIWLIRYGNVDNPDQRIAQDIGRILSGHAPGWCFIRLF
jgi:ABC-type uncharacterized transport system fused permease/ATPase subunit